MGSYTELSGCGWHQGETVTGAGRGRHSTLATRREPALSRQLGQLFSQRCCGIHAELFHTATDDYARDPELKQWVEEGGSTNDKEIRTIAYAKAIKRVTEQAYLLPIHTYVSTYAFSKTLNFTPFADELPRFFLAKWN